MKAWTKRVLFGIGVILSICASAYRFLADQGLHRRFDEIESIITDHDHKTEPKSVPIQWRKGCGRYRYRVGGACVDARNRS